MSPQPTPRERSSHASGHGKGSPRPIRPERSARQNRTKSSLCHLPDFKAERFKFVPRLFRGVSALERSGAHARLLALLAFDALGIALDACGSRPVLYLLRVVGIGEGAERDDEPLVVQQRLRSEERRVGKECRSRW